MACAHRPSAACDARDSQPASQPQGTLRPMYGDMPLTTRRSTLYMFMRWSSCFDWSLSSGCHASSVHGRTLLDDSHCGEHSKRTKYSYTCMAHSSHSDSGTHHHHLLRQTWASSVRIGPLSAQSDVHAALMTPSRSAHLLCCLAGLLAGCLPVPAWSHRASRAHLDRPDP